VAFKQLRFKRAIVLGISILLATLAQALCASPAPPGGPAPAISIRVPILGFLFDEQTRVLRSLYGGPESSILSKPWEFGSIKQIAVARRNRFGVAIMQETGQPVVVDLNEASGHILTTPDLGSNADLVVLSPSGISAAVYYRDIAAVKVLHGLPYKTAVVGSVFLRPGQQLRVLAVSDDAATVLAGIDEGGLNSIVLMSINGDSRPIFSTAGRAQITFLNRSHDSVIVDEGTGDVYLLRDPAVSTELTTLPGIKESIGMPVATRLALENDYAFFASVQTGKIARLELSTGWISVTDCACRPDGLWPLSRNSLFRLSGPSESPIWIYDATKRDPITYVLPVHNEASWLESGRESQ
jgi:hypothetical protein